MFPVEGPIPELEYSTRCLRKTRGVTIACLNVQSVTRKLDDIRELLHGSRIDCLCINETFLNNSIDTSLLNVDGYYIIRHDRTDASGKKGGGGVDDVYSQRQKCD